MGWLLAYLGIGTILAFLVHRAADDADRQFLVATAPIGHGLIVALWPGIILAGAMSAVWK